MPLNKEEIRILEEDGWEMVCESPLEFEKSEERFLNTEKEQRIELSNIISKTQEAEDDIKYFKKKILNAVIDEEWDSVISAANRLKQAEDCILVYRITRNPEKRVLGTDGERIL